MNTRFDIESLKRQADLARIVERYLHSPVKVSGRWAWFRCPFHAAGSERTPSLGVTSDNGLFKCFGCGASGDVIEFVRRMEKLGTDGKGFVDSVKIISDLVGSDVARAETPVRVSRPPVDQRPPSGKWQRGARTVVAAAQRMLWETEGRGALRYLTEKRGLTEQTIRAWGLGWHVNTSYLQADALGLDRAKDVWLPQGLVIPGEVAGVLWYVKFRPVRAVKFGGKYYGIPGGKTALLGADRWTPGLPLLLCEGEMDAFTAWQVLRVKANVATLGGAAKGRRGGKVNFGRWTGALLQAKRILAAFDTDAAGQEAGEALAGASERVERVQVPYGEDINGFHVMGGDLSAWFEAVSGESKVTSQKSKVKTGSRWPMVMVFEGGAGLALPHGMWRRLEDGRLEATIAGPEVLEAVLWATRAARVGRESANNHTRR